MDKKNTTKKSIKPTFIVDITQCESVDDVKVSFIYAKVKNGICITVDELIFITLKAINTTISTYHLVDRIVLDIAETLNCGCSTIENFCKKEPWYKRLLDKLKSVFA